MRLRLAAQLLLLALVAGAALAADVSPEPPRPRVVVAAIDSAPNPYHGFFHAGGSNYVDAAPSSVTQDVLDEFGIGPEHVIEVTRTGNVDADLAADKAKFDAIEAGQPYWFEGTNVIGVSFNAAGQRLRPDTGSAHGIGVSASVLNANPEAIVVMVESPSLGGIDPNGYAIRPQGEQWAFTHPAVDIVTTSYGPPNSPPLGFHLNRSWEGVVRNGKLHFGASDNSAALSPFDATSGPWWTIGIAGFGEGSHEGKETTSSGTAPDFVADWTQRLPYCRKCVTGESNVSGTSFATPTSAGVASDVLLRTRRAAGHVGGIVDGAMVVDGTATVTNWDIRRALEEAAYYPKTADWSPSLGSTPVVDAAPWATTGWGAITPDPAHGVVDAALTHLGYGSGTIRIKSPHACDFMTANIDVRIAYWDDVARNSQSEGGSEAYARC